MSLTKEECENALYGLRVLEREENLKKHNQVAPQIKCDILEQLSNEHFELIDKYNELEEQHVKLLSQWGKSDNPPLKFEELKEMIGKPIWDDKYKEWAILRKAYEETVNDGVLVKHMICMGTKGIYHAWYENERFYRNQVE